MHSHPQAEVVQSKTTGQFACYSKNDKPDSIQLKHNTWDPQSIYDTCSDCEGLDDSSNAGSPDKYADTQLSSTGESNSDSDNCDFEEWVNEQLRICRAIQDSYKYEAESEYLSG